MMTIRQAGFVLDKTYNRMWRAVHKLVPTPAKIGNAIVLTPEQFESVRQYFDKREQEEHAK